MVNFAGDGNKDVGDGNMKEMRSPGFQSGGPVKFAKGMEEGVTASGEPINVDGEMPGGSSKIDFVGGE